MVKTPVTIYLASQSPRRRYLLKKNGYRCRVIPSSYVEIHESDCCPRELVLKHAAGKLRDAAVMPRSRFIVAADTVVAFKGKVYGKPAGMRSAEQMLGRLAGQTHDVYTAWAMRDLLKGKKCLRSVRSEVKLRPMTPAQIRSYFMKVNPLDKAGAYAVQSRPSIVESIQGSYSNVMGFPMEDFEKVMRRWL